MEKLLSERPDVTFIGCHPLAGSEKRGVQYAPEVHLEGALCILTPTDATPAAALEKVHNFWQSIGMRTVELSAAEHDRTLARISHVPHFVASALALVPLPVNGRYAGGGFLDTTRLAAGDPDLWAAIAAHNGKEIATALDSMIHHLQDLRHMIDHGNAAAVRAFLEEARNAHRQILESSTAPPETTTDRAETIAPGRPTASS
jgi:prephenate dehydrogenase